MANICFFLGNDQGKGGISRVTWILANKLSEKYSIHVLSDWHTDDKRYEYNTNVTVSHIFEEQRSVHKKFFELVRSIHDYINNNSIDILVGASAIYFPACSMAVKGTKTKLIIWEHSNVSVKGEFLFQQTCRKIGSKYADKIITLTNKDKEQYEQRYKVNKCQRIYNPVDERLIRDIHYDSDSKKIISVGRLCYQKNFELLVDIADVILKKHPDWVWHIYGEGENRKNIEDKIKKYKLDNQLILKGNVSNLYELYKEYSFLVMTSRFEGFPMTLLESTASGLPAVSFDILTGPNEIIKPGITGELIKPDAVDEMSIAIETLMNSEALRRKMSEACEDERNRFKCDTIVEEWNQLFKEILNS